MRKAGGAEVTDAPDAGSFDGMRLQKLREKRHRFIFSTFSSIDGNRSSAGLSRLNLVLGLQKRTDPFWAAVNSLLLFVLFSLSF